MIVEKLRHVKRHKELVAFAAKLDDVIPNTSNKLCISRESDGRMFYVAHVFMFDEHPECQDPVILIIGDVDGYLKEGDDVTLIEHLEDTRRGGYQYWGEDIPRDFHRQHDIPGGWWRGAGGMPDTYKCSGYCQQCGKKCGKERHF